MQAAVRAVTCRCTNLAPAVIARARTVATGSGPRGGRTARCRRPAYCDETWHQELDELVELGRRAKRSARLEARINYFVALAASIATIEMYHYFNPTTVARSDDGIYADEG